MSLAGKKVAILIAPKGTEEPEFVQPRDAVTQAGAALTVVGLEAGSAETKNHDLDPGGTYPVDATIGDVSADQFDALIIPGGTVGADKLRANHDVIAFVRSFFDQEKPVAAICHGPWLLVEANVVKNRTLTSFPTLKTDIGNAGGDWVDQEVCVDNGLITSRNPNDLPAFCAKLIEEIGEGRHAGQAASA